VSAEIIPLPTRRQPARNSPVEPAETEPDDDDIALFVLTGSGSATAWVSENVQTAEHWDYVLDFIRQVEVALLRLRAERGR
jgi:hypothetical protein